MEKATIIGVDLAKHVFQVHVACADGSVAFRKKISRAKFLPFLASQPRCVVAMEACAGAHGWARDIQAQGHEVRLIAPAYAKPFVKRQKNDMSDAEAITEAAAHPTMRFVAVKSAEKQASCMVFQNPGPAGPATDTDDQCAARSLDGARDYCAARGISRRPACSRGGEREQPPAEHRYRAVHAAAPAHRRA